MDPVWSSRIRGHASGTAARDPSLEIRKPAFYPLIVVHRRSALPEFSSFTAWNPCFDLESGFQVPMVLMPVMRIRIVLSSWESDVSPKSCANLTGEINCCLFLDVVVRNRSSVTFRRR